MTTEEIAFYTAHDALTNPGAYAGHLKELPPYLAGVHRVLNGFLIHIWKIRTQHVGLLHGRGDEVFIRHVATLLQRVMALDDRSLTLERPIEQRMIIDCRHFATVLCSILRERGIPARPRCGFATYLEPTHYQDHWIVEYWDDARQRWIMEDADLMRHDVPAEEFITGARAWLMCRADASLLERFGFDADFRGIDVVRTNLVRDFAALNGFASVSGDAWGLALRGQESLSTSELDALDHAARLSLHDGDCQTRRELYAACDGLRVPTRIQNFDYVVANAWRDVDWQKEP